VSKLERNGYLLVSLYGHNYNKVVSQYGRIQKFSGEGEMKEETADRYVAVIKRGLDIIHGAIAQIAEEVGAKTPEELEAIRRGIQLAPAMKILGVNGEAVPLRKPSGEVDYKAFKELLLKAPEPTSVQLAPTLEMLNSLPGVMRGALARTIKKLPHSPGGHPFALKDPELRLAVCKRIETYRIRDHLDTAEAIQRVASELKQSVSRKTLRRYYDKFIKESNASAPARSSKKEVAKKQKS
jgi:hypothetical protein